MSRTMSATATSALLAQQTGQVFVGLLEIHHDDLGEANPVRVTNCGADVVHDGHTYVNTHYKIVLPAESDDVVARVRLEFFAQEEIVEALLTVADPPEVKYFVVLHDTPDVIEAGPFEMTLRQAVGDVLMVEAECAWEDILDQVFPAHAITPSRFPGAFS